MPSNELRLLPESALVRTGDVDHADWNYRPLVGSIQRRRFKLIRSMLRGRHYRRLLEIGYGSGVFMPELSRFCDELYGIDPHSQGDQVQAMLEKHGAKAHLTSGGANKMPYEDGFFDAVVAVSSLEFIDNLSQACGEIKRVLSPDGVFLLVTPGQSMLLDLGVRVLTGCSPKDDFGDRRKKILTCLSEQFQVEHRVDWPPVIHPFMRIYTAMRLSKAG